MAAPAYVVAAFRQRPDGAATVLAGPFPIVVAARRQVPFQAVAAELRARPVYFGYRRRHRISQTSALASRTSADGSGVEADPGGDETACTPGAVRPGGVPVGPSTSTIGSAPGHSYPSPKPGGHAIQPGAMIGQIGAGAAIVGGAGEGGTLAGVLPGMTSAAPEQTRRQAATDARAT